MSDIEILNKIVRKLKKLNRSSNSVDFIPRQTLSIKINNENYYISLICNNNFQVQVVVLDENNNVVYKILDIDDDKASIIKLHNNLYVFTNNNAYIYDINNLKAQPIKVFLGNLDLQGICSNQNSIFAYSITKDKIIKYDKDLLIVQEYQNLYSRDNLRISLNLACNEKEFFSIPIMVPTEEQYVLMKKFMEHYINPEVAQQNDQIHSCSFNIDDNTLYISMYDLILIIKDGIEFSYLYFKDGAMTTTFYDNDLKKLIINFGEIKGKCIMGSITKLSDSEINEKAIPLNYIEGTFQHLENLSKPSLNLIDNNIDKMDAKRNR